MRRREFIRLLGGAAAWPLAAHAQPGQRIRRIGALFPFTAEDAEGRTIIAALRQGLEKLDWIEDRNIRIDFRFGGGDVVRTQAYAKELVDLSPEVIYALFNGQLAPLSRATGTISIVFIGASDPIGAGYVESFAHPGRNITGFILFEPSMVGKWLQALKELVPSVSQAAIMFNPETATRQGSFYSHAFEVAAAALSVEPSIAEVHGAKDIEATIAILGKKSNGALVVASDTFNTVNSELIVELAARYHLPTVYPLQHFVKIGGLMSYGPDTVDIVRHSASYIDRILKGEKPAELPVQAPTKYELVINLKTAKALGLTIPPTLLARADEMIE
jgi:putative ABC transport system substrate-binding protein